MPATATSTRRRNVPVFAGPECCPTGLAEPMDRTTAEALAVLLKAVADPARLQLLALIRTAVLASALSQYNANGQLLSSTAPVTQVAATSATSATSQLMGQTSTTQTTVTKNGGSTS